MHRRKAENLGLISNRTLALGKFQPTSLKRFRSLRDAATRCNPTAGLPWFSSSDPYHHSNYYGATKNIFRVNIGGQVFAEAGYFTGGADFAESVVGSGARNLYHPGDVLVIDPSSKRQVALSKQPYSTLVAGIYSTKPGVLAGTHGMGENPASELPLAVVGIVPCKVTAENGAIQAGDLLVTSSREGYAMKGTDRSKIAGAVLGKALEPLPDGIGVIQVLVTLQ